MGWPKLYIFTIIILLTCLSYCKTEDAGQKEGEYLNWQADVNYVGSEACGTCHQEIFKSFARTGMGESFHFATKEKSAGTYPDHLLIRDSINDLNYQPVWRNDSMFVKEFRLSKTNQLDTLHQREMHIKYIIGSGQHTNSHIIDDNGYLSQAPITFYTQKGFWDLAPGFDSPLANRLNRIIGKECMTCHNSYPEFVEESENKFTSVPLGIGCERCHGPGEEHIKRKIAGEVIDTSKYIDYSIVNPGKLSKELQMSVCQRCHAQGVAILKDGKGFEDFQPGKHISEVMDVFLPKFDGHQTSFIMASHADRTAMSQCYKMSDMTCISCHNPHVSVKETPMAKFNSACKNCHSSLEEKQTLCTLPINERQEKNDNCSGCHMPETGSIDIPHVTIHDHFIRKPIPENEKNQIEKFIGLANITNPESKDNLLRGKSYLRYFEAFQSENRMLDSAEHYLKLAPKSNDQSESLLHLYYLRSDFTRLLAIGKKMKKEDLKDDWSLYRIGEAHYSFGNAREAEKYFQSAVERKPFNLDFLNKLGSAKMKRNQIKEAGEIFASIIEENDQHIAALNNYGFVSFNMKDFDKAEELYNRALAISPDYVPGLLNKIGMAFYRQDTKTAKQLLDRVLEIDPENEKAKYIRAEGILEQ